MTHADMRQGLGHIWQIADWIVLRQARSNRPISHACAPDPGTTILREVYVAAGNLTSSITVFRVEATLKLEGT